MILILGSSSRAASQSVETSGSSVGGIGISFCHSGMRAKHADPESRSYDCEIPGSRCARPGMTKRILTLRRLRLDLLDRAAGIAPGGEAAADMRDRFQSHVLRGFRRQRRAHPAGAMKDELLVALKNRLRIGAGRIDPEFQHTAGAGERAGNFAVALDLAGIADIDDHDVVVVGDFNGFGSAEGFDLRIGLVDQRLDAAVNGLGHWSLLSFRGDAKHQTVQLHIGESRSNFVTSGFRVRANARPGMTTAVSTAPIPSSR